MGGPTKVVEDFVQDTSNTLTQIAQPLEKAVTAGVEDTSKNLTTVAQPVEKAVSKATADFSADPSKATTNLLQPVEKVVNYIGAHPDMQLSIAMMVAVPVVGSYIGAELMAAGVVTSAEAASAAAIANGANAAQAAAAAQAATATATTIGVAIASTTAQVAQGVPLEKAIENTAADVAVAQLSPAAAKKLDSLLHAPAVTDAITSTVASGLKTAALGGSQADVEKAMTAGLAGSTASSIYKGAIDSSSEVVSKAVGGAAAGAVKSGTEGAVLGGLSSAAGALARPSKEEPTPPTPPSVAPPLDQTAAEDARLARKEASIAGSEKGAYMPEGSFVAPIEEPKQGAYLPDSATAPTASSDAATAKTPYKPDIFISTVSPKSKVGGAASSEALGEALGTTTGLTASRGAGEIEGTGTGGQRKKVWNEESLKLKDALGV
jgi:hypothetical protein